jgi:hypothetical protein
MTEEESALEGINAECPLRDYEERATKYNEAGEKAVWVQWVKVTD